MGEDARTRQGERKREVEEGREGKREKRDKGWVLERT